MSTVSWGSAFPTTWPRKRIKYLCRFAGGGTPDKGNPEYWNGEIPWVSPKDMKSATVDDTEDHITTDGLESSAAKLVAPGAVLLVMRSGILRHSIPVAINRVSIALNQDMRALIPFPQVEARFLARLLEGHQQQLLNVWSKVGSTVESLESDLVGETEIAVPVLDQQRAIADYLDRETARLDALVAAKKRVLGLLAEKRRSLITRAVTRGLDPHAPLRDSGIPWLGNIPAHWTVGRLKDFGTFFAGSGFPHEFQGVLGEILPFYKVGDLATSSDDRYMGQAPNTVSYDTASQLHSHIVPTGAVVYAKIGAALFLNRRRVATAACCIDNNMTAYVPDCEVLDSGWAFYWTGILDFGALANPGAVPSLSEGDQKQLAIVVPPVTEQQTIADHLDRETARLNDLAVKTRRTMALIKERRAALIAATVTGRLEVM